MITQHFRHLTRPLLLALFGITSPAFAKDFSVRDHGATGDGTTLDTAAIQKTIAVASTAGGGRVILPAGTYRSGSIRLKDKIEQRPRPRGMERRHRRWQGWRAPKGHIVVTDGTHASISISNTPGPHNGRRDGPPLTTAHAVRGGALPGQCGIE